ncbi:MULTISPECIES: arginine repressor [Loigolactobacillus]|uniref:Arginine repressor n=1 Tax=Loigolactobacillus backii TaxID=375175 RepID=A0A192H4B2_9LACO|nr:MULTISPECIES: arginine repressor [Loigolactobacillus]ANK59364.1 ArgR family transcriptional regulator [Loigolactobacillus backii]ANK63057.1 ArgR family transcriptional regulator [Loigolactobacillus backii]ANK64357.1 ArgR family transcriptional regulator [Loigolactobacillus backii]ANK67247.1 ArgR family transcriptional regulator [Loigolactobacillus backii]ANK69935.1 ArgR family transcriptional regulator [Loigolactobacillus backii]
MRKVERQRIIRQLLDEHDVEKQEDLVALLDHADIKVTQATISRDIKDMQLVKVPSPSGGYRYSLPAQQAMDTEKKLKRTLYDAYVSLDVQDYFIVLKALPGNGTAIATLIDQMNFDGAFGTIGGDDTVLIIAKSADDAQHLYQTLLDLLEQ